MKYKIWDKQSNLVTPTMKVMTPQDVFAEYPAAELEGFKFIVCDAPVSMGVFMEYETTKQTYKQLGAAITDGMNESQVLSAISHYEENPPETGPSPEERQASALEFQNMMLIAKEGGNA